VQFVNAFGFGIGNGNVFSLRCAFMQHLMSRVNWPTKIIATGTLIQRIEAVTASETILFISCITYNNAYPLCTSTAFVIIIWEQ